MVGMDLADSEPPKGVCAVGVDRYWWVEPIAYRLSPFAWTTDGRWPMADGR